MAKARVGKVKIKQKVETPDYVTHQTETFISMQNNTLNVIKVNYKDTRMILFVVLYLFLLLICSKFSTTSTTFFSCFFFIWLMRPYVQIGVTRKTCAWRRAFANYFFCFFQGLAVVLTTAVFKSIKAVA